MAKKTANQMKDRRFSQKGAMSVITFLQTVKSSCDAYKINEGAVMWLFKQSLTKPAKAAVHSHVALTSSANTAYEGALRTYFDVVNFLLKRYVTESNIAAIANGVGSIK